MLTNKDIRVDNGNIVINGDKYPLDGQSPETIMQIVEDNSDTTPTENSTAPITSGGTFTALGTKQDTLTFDSAPTYESTNPVTSGGVFSALQNKLDIAESALTAVSNSVPLTANTPIDIDTGSGDGVYLVLIAQSAGLDLTELYVAKVTNYAGGTTAKPLLQAQTYASTVTATARSSEANGKITITAAVNCTCSVFKFNIF